MNMANNPSIVINRSVKYNASTVTIILNDNSELYLNCIADGFGTYSMVMPLDSDGQTIYNSLIAWLKKNAHGQ